MPTLQEINFRHAAYYKIVAATAEGLYDEGGDAAERGLGMFSLDWQNIEAGSAWARQHSDGDDAIAKLCVEYARAAPNLYALRQHPTKRILSVGAALESARRLRDRSAEIGVLSILGSAWMDMGDASRAKKLHQQRLDLCREVSQNESRSGDFSSFLIVPGADESRSNSRSIELANQLAEELNIDTHVNDGNTLILLGNARLQLGEADEAIEIYELALSVAKRTGDRGLEGDALGSLGNIQILLGEHSRAGELYEQVLTIARELCDRKREGDSLASLGAIQIGLGEYSRANELLKQGLMIFREIGYRRGICICLMNLGTVYKCIDNADRATELYQQSLSLAREIEDRQNEGLVTYQFSLHLYDTGNHALAIEHAKVALEILGQIHDFRARVVIDRLAKWGINIKKWWQFWKP